RSLAGAPSRVNARARWMTALDVCRLLLGVLSRARPAPPFLQRLVGLGPALPVAAAYERRHPGDPDLARELPVLVDRRLERALLDHLARRVDRQPDLGDDL